MRLLLLLVAAGTMYGQTVASQVAAGMPIQTASVAQGFKKIPKLILTLFCPNVPQDAAGNYLVVAGTSVTCTFTVNSPPSDPAGTTLTPLSSDTTAFTVPASVLIPQGALVSAAFNVTATP